METLFSSSNLKHGVSLRWASSSSRTRNRWGFNKLDHHKKGNKKTKTKKIWACFYTSSPAHSFTCAPVLLQQTCLGENGAISIRHSSQGGFSQAAALCSFISLVRVWGFLIHKSHEKTNVKEKKEKKKTHQI